MINKRLEEYDLLRDDLANKERNTLTAKNSLSNNPESLWLVENLNDCIMAEALAKEKLEAYGECNLYKQIWLLGLL